MKVLTHIHPFDLVVREKLPHLARRVSSITMSRRISSGLETGLGSLMVRTSSTLGVSPIQCELGVPWDAEKAKCTVVSKWVLRWNLRS
jgi:hypothetical protein